MELKEAYEILGVREGSTEADVRLAYRDLVTVWHPDRFSHNPRLSAKAEEQLKVVNTAFEKILASLPQHCEPVGGCSRATPSHTTMNDVQNPSGPSRDQLPIALPNLMFAFIMTWVLPDLFREPLRWYLTGFMALHFVFVTVMCSTADFPYWHGLLIIAARFATGCSYLSLVVVLPLYAVVHLMCVAFCLEGVVRGRRVTASKWDRVIRFFAKGLDDRKWTDREE